RVVHAGRAACDPQGRLARPLSCDRPRAPAVIRRATPEDAPAIAGIHVRSWQRDYADIIDPRFLAELDVSEREQKWRGWLGDGDALARGAPGGGPGGRLGSFLGGHLHT